MERYPGSEKKKKEKKTKPIREKGKHLSKTCMSFISFILFYLDVIYPREDERKRKFKKTLVMTV